MAVDFPARCRDLLSKFYRRAQKDDREVTLMLLVATAGFVVPYERLRPRHGGDEKPAGDRRSFLDASAALDGILKQTLQDSRYLDCRECKWEWCSPISDEMWRQRGIDGAESYSYRALPLEMSLEKFLNHVRNALAHGSVFTRGYPSIDRLFLLAKPSRRAPSYDLLVGSPAAFYQFLIAWFDLLEKLPFPSGASPMFAMELPFDVSQSPFENED